MVSQYSPSTFVSGSFLRLLSVGALALLVFEVLQVTVRVRAGRAAAARTVRFERVRSNSALRILVAGDSTGVGVAAGDPALSVAGRFGSAYPAAHVENTSRNGARTRHVIGQLQARRGEPHSASRAPRGGHFTLVLLQTGGNDILRFTPLEDLRRDINATLDEAMQLGDHVVLLTAGNVGLAPLFPRPIGWLYTARARRVRALFQVAAREHGVVFADPFAERDNDIFLTDPPRYYAPDFLHLSGEGYRVWFEKVAAAFADSGVRLGTAAEDGAKQE